LLLDQEILGDNGSHAAGNYRIFIAMAAELLMSAAQRDITVLDEKLYLQVFAQPEDKGVRRVSAARRHATTPTGAHHERAPETVRVP
jgi:hypothetical protein